MPAEPLNLPIRDPLTNDFRRAAAYHTRGEGTGAATKLINFESAAPKPLAFGQLDLLTPGSCLRRI